MTVLPSTNDLLVQGLVEREIVHIQYCRTFAICHGPRLIEAGGDATVQLKLQR